MRSQEPPECHTRQVPEQPVKVMFWTAIGPIYEEWRSPLYVHHTSVNADTYCECLENILLQITNCARPRYMWKFMQDGCKRGPHSSLKVRDKLFEMGVNVLGDTWSSTWPPNSPDLNSIEFLWTVLKYRVDKRCPRTKEELIRVACEESDLNPTQSVRNTHKKGPCLVRNVCCICTVYALHKLNVQ